MKQYKHAIYKFLLTIIITPTLLFTLIFLYDPLQIFHKPFLRKSTFHSNMREQAAGIINNYKFDSILLGTSMLQNTSAEEASQKLNENFVNLSIAGSDFYERAYVLKYALKKHNIKTVIYSLDANAYFQQRTGQKTTIETFKKLYDNNIFNNFTIYLNTKYIKCLLTLSTNSKCIGDATNLNYPGKWFDNYRDYIRFGGIKNWFNISLKEEELNSLNTIVTTINNNKTYTSNTTKSAIKYINNNIISIVKENKNTKFILFFPPYSRLQYALWAQKDINKFNIHKNIITYLVEKSSDLNNLKIYAFGKEDFLDNLENYIDLHHYHKNFNSLMLNSFKSQSALLTKANLEEYLSTITNKSLTYDIYTPAKNIKYYLNNKKLN